MPDGAATQPEQLPPPSLTENPGDAVNAAAEAQRRANTLLLGAIAAGDAQLFEQAAREKADVNFDGGRPLQLAAEKKDFLFLRLLLTRGADVSHAVASLQAEQAGIKRKRHFDDYDYTTRYTFKNKAEEQRWKQIAAAVKTLGDYEKTYRDTIAPLEAVRLQQQMLDELRAVKDDITLALHGRPLQKAKLPAPRTAQPGTTNG